MSTYVIYNGPSVIDGKPIVVLFQEESRNKKTGGMCQTYIIRSDIDPVSASRTGEDFSICGNCIHRGEPTELDKGQAKDRTCYVTLAHGPLGKYKGYKKGLYTPVSGHKAISGIGFGRVIRVGTYGDPCAVPKYIWDSLLERCESWTAYTHGDTNIDPKKYMTSADTYEGAKNAWNRGERTFRVIADVSQVDKANEFLCPASKESEKTYGKMTCEKCRLCSGSSVKAKSVAIVAHGTSKNKYINKLNTGV